MVQTTRVGLDACAGLTGAVVVVDVLRSFTTAAYAFAAGAATLLAADTDAQASGLRHAHPGAVTIGSLPGGMPAPGFDLPNSPSRLAPGPAGPPDLGGRTVVLSTAGGVRGIANSRGADLLVAASMVCARATASLLRRHAPARIAFVITGVWSDRDGDEDHACADLIEALLDDARTDPAPFEARVRHSDFGRRFTGGPESALPRADLDCCARADRFDFALRARREAGRIELVRETVPPA